MKTEKTEAYGTMKYKELVEKLWNHGVQRMQQKIKNLHTWRRVDLKKGKESYGTKVDCYRTSISNRRVKTATE